MVNQIQRIKPHTGFVVSLAADFSAFSEQNFTNLYQPIIGANAFALFFALQTNVEAHPMLSKRVGHTKLLNRLNFDIDQLTEARARLESAGMLKTFETTDSLGEAVVYELQPTLTVHQFNNDDLLSVLLLEAIGDADYTALINQATQYQLNTRDLKQTTQSFFGSYHVAQSEVEQVPDVIQESRQKFVISDNAQPQIADSKFDFQLLLNLVDQQPIRIDGVEKHQQLIITEHVMYGIDEMTMARMVGQSINLNTNELDENKFKRNIVQAFTMVQPVQTMEPEQQEVPVTKADANQLTPKDQQLLKVVEAYTPNEFLTDLLKEKGGYISNNQRANLTALINRNLFPSTVVNLLIYYLLVEMDQTTLTQALMDTVANGWAQAKVRTPIQAFDQIKTYQKKRQTRKQPARKGQVKETLPDWAKEDYQPKKKETSAEELAAIQAQMERLNKSKKG